MATLTGAVGTVPDDLRGAEPGRSVPLYERGLRVLLAALNHLLAADASARASLAPHAGRLLRIELRRTSELIAGTTLRIGPQGLLEAGDAGGEPAVTMVVKASVDAGFAALSRGPSGLQHHLRIEGDVLLAAAIGELSRSLRWDVEEDLSRITGDVIARRLAGFASGAASALRDLGERMGVGFARRWSVEDPVLVTRAELSGHSDALSSLESRLALLERQWGSRR